MKQEDGGQAIIEDGAIVIRVSLDALPMVLEGAWAMAKLDARYKITDVGEFAKELVYVLNHEDEQGTTAIHEMFDQAILDAIEQGAFGIDEYTPHSLPFHDETMDGLGALTIRRPD